MHRQIGLENLTVLELAPPDIVELAADLGFGSISLYANGGPGAVGREVFSLKQDTLLRRETAARARDRGIEIALLDGFVLLPGTRPSELEPSFAIMAELGIRRANAVSLDPDWSRTVDGFGGFCDLAQAYGVRPLVEPCPYLTIRSLDDARAIINAVGGPSRLAVLVDTMHLGRWGTTPEEIAALNPALFGYVQLCDGPVGLGTRDSYRHDAVANRLPPGKGALPLAGYLTALPRDLIVSVEVPMIGKEPRNRASLAMNGALKLLTDAVR